MLARRACEEENMLGNDRTEGFAMPGDRWPVVISSAEIQAPNPVLQAAATADLYAAAWSMAQRDFELDRLFNAAFYYEI